MATITLYETLVTTSCCACGIRFAVPQDFLDKRQEDPNRNFYCPNGHSLSYRTPTWQKEMDQLKREKEQLEQSRSRLHNELMEKNTKLKSAERKIKSTTKRLAAGVCPCCHRTFKQLADHMKKMHPEVVKEKPVEEIHKKINAKT